MATACRPVLSHSKRFWHDAHAAAELLKTTGDRKYDEAFMQHVPLIDEQRHLGMPLFKSGDYALAFLSYLGAEDANDAQWRAVKEARRAHRSLVRHCQGQLFSNG